MSNTVNIIGQASFLVNVGDNDFKISFCLLCKKFEIQLIYSKQKEKAVS